MKDFTRKRKILKRLYSKVVLIFLLLVLMFSIHNTWKIWQKSKQSKKAFDVVRTEYQKLEEKEENIQNRIDILDTQTGLEEEIRSKFYVAREGEKMIIIVNEESDEDKVLEEKEEKIKDKIIKKISSWF
jgi:cell division protein FtsB